MNTVFVAPPSAHETTPDVASDAVAVAIEGPALGTTPSRSSEQPGRAPGHRESEPASAARPVSAAIDTRPVDALPVAVPPLEPPSTGAPRLARSANPYLNNTPELRARRLARALVSDLVAYNPQKREEGLRNGTLRQLFRDEIRKSWDEYVEQVGAHVAESTPHFQDALNDVLAGGRRVF